MTKAIRIPPCSTCGVTRRIRLPWRRCTWASNGAGSVIESIVAAAAAVGRDDEKRADLTGGKRRVLVALEVALNRLCELSIHSSERIGGRGEENKPRVEIATRWFFHAPPVGPSPAFPAAPAGSVVLPERSFTSTELGQSYGGSAGFSARRPRGVATLARVRPERSRPRTTRLGPVGARTSLLHVPRRCLYLARGGPARSQVAGGAPVQERSRKVLAQGGSPVRLLFAICDAHRSPVLGSAGSASERAELRVDEPGSPFPPFFAFRPPAVPSRRRRKTPFGLACCR